MKGLWVFLAVFMVAVLWASADDAIMQAQDDHHYCEMTRLWLSQMDREPGMRDGWPPFRGECR